MPNRRSALALLALSGPALQRAVAAEPLKILFVDTGNTGRSLMSETLSRDLIKRGGSFVAVISRGLDVDPFDEAPEANAQTLMAQRGFDVSAHRAHRLEASDVAHADLILTMTGDHAAKLTAAYPQAKAKTFTLAGYATGVEEAIPDAWGKPMAVYVAVVAQLDRYLPLALAKAIAGDKETSLMLHFRPELVKMDKAANFAPSTIEIAQTFDLLRPTGFTAFGWIAPDLHPSGAAGDASLGTAEKGRLTAEFQALKFIQLLAQVV